MSNSLGILDGIKQRMEEEKNINSKEAKKEGIAEEKSKRSYELKNSTIKKLDELKLYHYGVNVKLQDIVDEAICLLYESKVIK